MASLMKMNNPAKDDEDEDLEALRMAALMTLRKKQTPLPPPPPPPVVTFQPHMGNPNLIAIIPEGADRQHVHKQVPRQNFYRHPPGRQFRPPNNTSNIGSTLKVLPQVKINKDSAAASNLENNEQEDKEEVSTKFSRFEDTESESEDESEAEKKKSDDSSDESDDVLALEDDDDSLEALMAQMEHEIEEGIDPEPSKKERKKSKGSKSKDKEAKVKDGKTIPDKGKTETKTAVVEPTVKDADEIRLAKVEDNKERNNSPPLTAREPPVASLVKIHPLRTNGKDQNNKDSPLRKSRSPVIRRSQSPLKQRPKTPPQRPRTPSIRIITKPKTSSKERSCSPRKSPVRTKSPVFRALSPARRKSPRRITPDRRSPLRRSPDRYYSGNKSPSPFYRVRDREYAPVRKSRSPFRRRSLSPVLRRNQREPSPRYYNRRSRSPLPRSPVYGPVSPSYSYRSRSPVRRRSLSPRAKKYPKSVYTPPPYYGSPKVRSSLSPRRSNSPRKRDYSPRRRPLSPRREINRRKSDSPKRKLSPPYKKYSPPCSPKYNQRSPSPRRKVSPKRRSSPVPVKESRAKVEQRSKTPSLSLSPSPPRESKEPARRYKSPLRPRKESGANVNNRISRARRGHTPEGKHIGETKERRKPKGWDREGRQWDRKGDERRKERVEKTDRDTKREKDSNRVERQKKEEPKASSPTPTLKVTDNPLFEARRKKFESNAVVAPASKKIRLSNKKNSPVSEKAVEEKKEKRILEEKKIVENSVQTEDDFFSGHEEIDEIDNFLNEDDVLDLSAEVWSSDDDLFPKTNKINKKKNKAKAKSPLKRPSSKEQITLMKEEKRKATVAVSTSPVEVKKPVAKSKVDSPPRRERVQQSPESEPEEERRDDSDLRAELSRRREERLTKAGSLHEKLPARLLQSAFESALGKKKLKKEVKTKKVKQLKIKEESPSPSPPRPVPKEKTDGRRVLVLKRPAPVRMQSAHINVTFPKADAPSDSESSYSSSTSEERYVPAAPKRKLPVYMRLGVGVPAPPVKSVRQARKVKLRSRRSKKPFLYVPIPLRFSTLVSDHYV